MAYESTERVGELNEREEGNEMRYYGHDLSFHELTAAIVFLGLTHQPGNVQ